MVGFNFAPAGWALCNGQLLSISQNQALYSLLGTTYGGDGVTTFALPDLRGRVGIHMGQGPGLSNYTIGTASGSEITTLGVPNLPPHNHNIKVATTPGNTKSGSGRAFGELSSSGDLYTSTAPSHNMADATIASTGSGAAFSNLQPYLCVNFIIALQGVFPSQS